MTWLDILHWYVTASLFLAFVGALKKWGRESWPLSFLAAAAVAFSLPFLILFHAKLSRWARIVPFRNMAKRAKNGP